MEKACLEDNNIKCLSLSSYEKPAKSRLYEMQSRFPKRVVQFIDCGLIFRWKINENNNGDISEKNPSINYLL